MLLPLLVLLLLLLLLLLPPRSLRQGSATQDRGNALERNDQERVNKSRSIYSDSACSESKVHPPTCTGEVSGREGLPLFGLVLVLSGTRGHAKGGGFCNETEEQLCSILFGPLNSRACYVVRESVCAPDSRPPSLEDLRGLVASANTIVLTSLVPARQRRFSLASHRTAYCRSL